MIKKLFLKSLAACSLALASAGALAVDVVRSGNLLYNTDVVRIDFTVAAPGQVTLYTDSWQGGVNFDPTLALFDAGFALATIGDDTADPSALLPGQGGFDSLIRFTAASGTYHLALTASGNDALGPTLADGFSLMGTTPILISEWNQPSYDINANDQKGNFWQVHLNGVAGADAVSPIPEPSEFALVLAGFTALGAVVGRRRKLERRESSAS